MNTAIYLQPFLVDLAQFAGAAVLAVAIPLGTRVADKIAQKFHLQSNAQAHAVIAGVAEDAVAFGEQYASRAITKVGPIETSDPKLAASANFLLTHAAPELAHLGFTEQHAIDIVRSTMQQNPKENST